MPNRGRQPEQARGRPQDRQRTYVSDPDDLLDQHVAYYFRHHPEVYKKHQIVRKRPGVYELNGREIAVEWQYGLLPGEQGFLVALDGPLRQPFADYMGQSEANAEYVSQGLSVNALHAVPLPSRMTFDDANRAYTRLEAMKVAKEQAIVREKAAEYSQMGMPPPNDLRMQYEKNITRKLNPGGRQRYPGAEAGPPPPVAMPSGGAMPQAMPQPMPAGFPVGTPSPVMGAPNMFGPAPNLMPHAATTAMPPAAMRGVSPVPRPMFGYR